jgi:hypothetical protein
MICALPTKGENLERPKKVGFGANLLIMTDYDGKEKTLS